MKKIKLISCILAMVVLFNCVTILNANKVYATDSQCVTVTTSGTYNYTMAQEVLKLVNQYRAEENLSSLELDTELLDVAMFRAAETSIYWSHTRPNGTSCFTASSKMNGENIAALSTTAAEVMVQWMNSEGHRANIMSSTYKSIGIGCYYSNGKYYWVQVFSNSSASSTSTKTGTQEVTEEIEVLGTSDYLQISVYGLASTKTLAVGNSYAASSVILTNQGWTLTTPISLTDLTWESSDTSVCTVDESGKITAVGAGQAVITATLGDSVTTYTITVTDSAETNDENNSTETSNTNASTNNTNTNAESETENSNSSSETTSSSSNSSTENTSSSPHTGDIAVEALIALMTISGIAIIGIILKIKKN